MLILLKKELTIISASVQGIIIPVIYLLITGLLLWVFDGSFNILTQGYSSIDGLFTISPTILLILIPALCMRSFTEEKRSGTEELLFTRPVRTGQIVFSKFFASAIIIFIGITLTGIYCISVWLLGNPPGNIDLGVTLGGYIALIMTILLFISMSEFASAVADNQITAFIIGTLFCTFFYWGFELISSAIPSPELQAFIRNIGINPHYQTLCEGIIDSRDIIYFIVCTSIFLTLTISVSKRSR